MHIIFVATDCTFWYRQAFSYPFNIGATMNESKLKHNKIYKNVHEWSNFNIQRNNKYS